MELAAWTPDVIQYSLNVAMGLCLAATCGLRTFLPLLTLNILALSGSLELNESFEFAGGWPATLVFGTATLVEVVGDKVPGIDHLMDGLGLLAKPIAATILAAAVLTDLDPLLAAVLGMIGGGASASLIGVLKAKVRAVSSVSTAGMGNVVLSVGEDAAALSTVVIAALFPALAVGAVGAGALVMILLLRRRRARARARAR
ncbi:MAG TPA: DUF4126 domain-containing protein [Deltaproteobacteria bacterium]|nr:DUF4126 domain-containing protein [Deltaproteobacteria bacterium]